MKKFRKRDLERISMDRKIVEGLRDAKSVAQLSKLTGRYCGKLWIEDESKAA